MYVLGMGQQRTGKSVDRRPVSFCDRFCVTFLLQDERQLPPFEKGLDLSSEWEERKTSTAGRGSVCNLARQSH